MISITHSGINKGRCTPKIVQTPSEFRSWDPRQRIIIIIIISAAKRKLQETDFFTN